WHNPTVAFRRAGAGRGQPAAGQPVTPATAVQPAAGQPAAPPAQPGPPAVVQTGALRNLPPAGPRQALRAAVSEAMAQKLAFGKSPDGAAIGPDDFASELSTSFEV